MMDLEIMKYFEKSLLKSREVISTIEIFILLLPFLRERETERVSSLES